MDDEPLGEQLSIGREAAISFAAQMLLAGSGFVGFVIFARLVGQEGLGTYYFLFAIAQVAARGPSGFGLAAKKRISEVESKRREIVGFGLLASASYVLVVGAVSLVIYPSVREYIGGVDLLGGLLFFFVALSLFEVTNQTYAGLGNPSAAMWADTVRSVLTLIFQVGLVLLGYGILGLLVGLAAATFLTAIGVLVAIDYRPAVPSRETAWDALEFAQWSIPNTALGELYTRVDVIVLRVVVTAAAVGTYSAADRLALPGALLAGAIANVLMVKTSNLTSLGEDVVADIRNSLGYSGLFAIPVFFGALAMPDALMGIVFGSDFRNTGIALIGMAFFQIFAGYRQTYEATVSGLDKPRLVFRVNVLTISINAPLAVLLGLEYGLLGVIAATVTAEAVRVAAYSAVLRSLLGVWIFPQSVVSQAVAGGIMFVAVSALTRAVPVRGWSTLVFAVVIGVLVYFVVLVGISESLRDTVIGILADVR